jgi:Tfp pilus assembly protein PilF
MKTTISGKMPEYCSAGVRSKHKNRFRLYVITRCFLSFSFLLCSVSFSYASNYSAYKSYLKGVLEVKAGLFDDAKKDYEKAVSADPNALTAYKDLAYLYWQSGDREKAFQTAEKIDAFDGKNPHTCIFLATFYLVANEPAAAKKYWEKTLELDPENETATVYLAAYYYSDNKLNESAQYWHKFLKQQPDSSSGYFQLGMVQEKLSMFD